MNERMYWKRKHYYNISNNKLAVSTSAPFRAGLLHEAFAVGEWHDVPIALDADLVAALGAVPARRSRV